MLFIRVFGAVLLGFPVSEQQQRKHTPGPAPPTLVTVVVTRYAFMHMARVRYVSDPPTITNSSGPRCGTHSPHPAVLLLRVSDVYRAHICPTHDDSDDY
jgi:hypothetical protein